MEFGLDPIVSPAFLTKGGQLHKGSYLRMKHGKVCPAHTGINVSLFVGVLCGTEVVACFGQIDRPSPYVFFAPQDDPVPVSTVSRTACPGRSGMRG